MTKLELHGKLASISRRDVLLGSATLALATAPISAHAQTRRHVRRNIYELHRQNDPEIASYARAVDRMMKKPIDDPTSWWFQANIHDYPNSGNSTGPFDQFTAPSKIGHFNKCPHGNFHFLPWHRLYLYYFERIVRKESGDASFALPYWNYEAPGEATLPPPFRWQDNLSLPEPVPVLERSNPLARARRIPLINSGLFGLGDTACSSASAMDLPNFLPNQPNEPCFGGDGTGDLKAPVQGGELEGQPHDVVHGLVGISEQDMSTTQTAARDPIFWLHHCQIDRLWVAWMNRGGGRTNPVSNRDWMMTAMTFFDENGQEVRHTAADALDTQLNLNYRYDTDPHRDGPAVVAAVVPSQAAAPPAELTRAAESGAPPLALGPRQVTVRIDLSDTGRARLNTAFASQPASLPRYHLTLGNIRLHGAFSGYYEIYLNKPSDQAPDPKGLHFVGTLGFFGVGHHGAGGRRAYDVTRIVSSGVANVGGGVNLTFVQRGAVGPAGEYLGDVAAQPEIGEIALYQSN